jgi:MinD-like ATPase involved in chromosome partitioning or flagellar assembly
MSSVTGLGGVVARLSRPGRHPIPGPLRAAVREVGWGMVNPAAAATMARHRALIRQARKRHRQPHLVAVLAGAGGVGTTTTAAGIGLTLAALRTDRTLLVDPGAGAAPLSQRLAGGRGPGPTPVRDLEVVDGARWHEPASGADPDALPGHLADGNEVVVLDVGNAPGAGAHAAVRHAGRIVIVSGTGPGAVASVRAALDRLHRSGPAPPGVVLAVVRLSRRRCRGSVRAMRRVLDAAGVGPAVVVPYDPSLAAGEALDPRRWRPATRQAYLTLAALVSAPAPAVR